jgi:hypothetical protein
MDGVIVWMLIWTVIVTFVFEMLHKYWSVLMTWASELLAWAGHLLLIALGVGAVLLVLMAVWTALQHWWEIQQIHLQTSRAIRRANAHYEKSRDEMERVAMVYRLRKGLTR